MKFRVRVNGQTVPVVIDDDAVWPVLVAAVRNALLADETLTAGYSLPDKLDLSLNKRDVLDGTEDTSVKELGLANGDLLFVTNVIPHASESTQDPKRPRTQAAPVQAPACDTGVTRHVDSHGLVWESTVTSTPVVGGTGESNRKTGADGSTPGTGVANEEGAARRATPGATLQDTGKDADGEREGAMVSAVDIVEHTTAGGSVSVIGQRGWPVPPRLIDLYTSAEPKTAPEALFVVAHALMLEAGFIPERTGATYRHTLLREPHTVDLKGVAMGTGIFYVHTQLVAEGRRGEVWSIRLPVLDYIRKGVDLGQGAESVYRNLETLAPVFRYSDEDGATLGGLLPELKLIILGYLPAKSLCALAQVNRQFHWLAYDQLLWKRLFLRVFGPPPSAKHARDFDWRKEYIRRARVEKERKRLVFLPAMPYVPPFPGIPHRGYYPPGFLGILGGDYDRFPLPPPPGFAGNPFAPHAGMDMGPDLARPTRNDPFGPGPLGGLGDPGNGIPSPGGTIPIPPPRGRGRGLGGLGGLGGGGGAWF